MTATYRLCTAAPGALLICGCLLFVMQALLEGPISERVTERTIPVEWVRLHAADTPPPSQEELERPMPVEQPPITRSPVTISNTPVIVDTTKPAMPKHSFGGQIYDDRTGPPADLDQVLVAIVRPQPHYPPTLAERGVEGYVIVGYSVSVSGTTENIVVVESSHPGFERAAKRAVERSRFRPRVVGGQPVMTNGLQALYRFELDHER